MKHVLNETAILHRMTREEAFNVKGGGIVVPSLPTSLCATPVDSLCNKPLASLCSIPVDSLCVKPTVPSLCDCLLAGCGCPSQTDCNQCAAGTDPGGM